MPYFEAGPYNWEWRNRSGAWQPLGVVDETPRFRVSHSGEEIRGDNLGDTIQDVVFRGFNLRLDLIFLEWIPTNLRAIWMYNHAVTYDLNQAWSRMTNVGCTSRSTAPELRATRIGHCPQNGGYQYYFPYVIPSPGIDLEILLGTRLRRLPVQFLILPRDNGDGSVSHYDVSLT